MNRAKLKAKIRDKSSQEYRWGEIDLEVGTGIDVLVGLVYSTQLPLQKTATIRGFLERAVDELINWSASPDFVKHEKTCQECEDARRHLARRIQLLRVLEKALADEASAPRKPYVERLDLARAAWRDVRDETNGRFVRAVKRYRELIFDLNYECPLRDAVNAVRATTPVWA